MNFGSRLKTLRLDADITQEALADKLGIKKQTISRYENSEREPNIRTAKKLADALGVTLEELVHGDSAPVSQVKEIESIYSALNKSGQAEYLRYGRYLTSQDEFRAADAEPQLEYIRHYTTAAAAGYAAPIEGEDYELIPKDGSVPAQADFSIDIAGDSMEPYIHDGQRVYVQRGADLQDLDVGIFFVDGDVYCKQYCIDYNGTLMLLSANENREDANIYMKKDSGRNVVCFGKVLLPRRLPMPCYK